MAPPARYVKGNLGPIIAKGVNLLNSLEKGGKKNKTGPAATPFNIDIIN